MQQREHEITRAEAEELLRALRSVDWALSEGEALLLQQAEHRLGRGEPLRIEEWRALCELYVECEADRDPRD